MKSLLFFVIGVFAGGYAVHVYEARDSAPAGLAGLSVSARDSVENRLQEWHLAPEDIRADLARTGEVFRAKAAVAGEKVSDARIHAVIKSKYILDRDLSARDIGVDVRDGDVVLSGTVTSTELIGRAVALALDTQGVKDVSARLTVVQKNSNP